MSIVQDYESFYFDIFTVLINLNPAEFWKKKGFIDLNTYFYYVRIKTTYLIIN